MLIALMIVLSSCSSGLTITKRRYNRGFYVHQHTSPGETGTASTKNKKNRKNTAFAANDQLFAEAPSDRDLLAMASAGPEGNGNINNPSTFTTAMLLATHPVKTFYELKNSISASPLSSEALSMLWILILVLLAAYIAGLLLDSFGLGWVIHILLVVALVLLVLWLLRVM